MTADQATKHKEIIKWWLDNSEKGVWFQNYKSDKWHLSYNPAFIEFDTYVQNDEYAELRKAQVDGKTIQLRTSALWCDVKDTKFKSPSECYRIKPDEPKLKVGDWVYDNENPNIRICQIEQIMLDYPVDDFDTRFKLWKPTKDEWCVFWDTDKKHYHISKFLGKYNKYNKYNSPINEYNEVFECIAPLEFTLTLRDK